MSRNTPLHALPARIARALAPIAFLFAIVPQLHAGEAMMLLPAQIKSLGVETAVVGEGDPGRPGSFPGRVVVPVDQMRVVAAPVVGMVEMLAFVPGDKVRKGQVLARLSSAQALELQREALQSASQASLLAQNLKRDEQLFGEGLIAESRLQATRAAASQAAAQAAERRQGLALAGGAGRKVGGPLALVAPIDGVILEQSAQLGQRLEAAAPIYRIARLSPLWVEIQVPRAQAESLREGMPVRIAGSAQPGKLITIGRAIDPSSQTVIVRALIEQDAERLTPGQSVAVEIALPKGNGQRVPAAAVVRIEGQPQAFVQSGSDAQAMRFELRPVRILDESGERVLVEGLKAGERIAIRGVSGLKAMATGVGRE